jgi:hypothetical protein
MVEFHSAKEEEGTRRMEGFEPLDMISTTVAVSGTVGCMVVTQSFVPVLYGAAALFGLGWHRRDLRNEKSKHTKMRLLWCNVRSDAEDCAATGSAGPVDQKRAEELVSDFERLKRSDADM